MAAPDVTRRKAHIDTDVLTEAKLRLHHLYDVCDNVVVSFSGGKDSTVVLHLAWEVARERGLHRVDAIFRDEEVIPREVVEFVATYRDVPWCNLTWYAVPLRNTKFVLGRVITYAAFGHDREWMREPPQYAVRSIPGYAPDHVFSQYDMDEVVAAGYRGKVCILSGVRAAESLQRYRACVNKLNENYIVASSTAKAVLGRPIFDWEENDVFRYFFDRGIRYCPVYDAQMWARMRLRVATPLTSEGAKVFDKLAAQDPEFYAQVTAAFPEMLAQERLWKDVDRAAIERQYGSSLDGVRAWVMENLADDEVQLHKALRELDGVVVRALRTPGAYPPRYVLRQFMTGNFKRTVQPLDENQRRSFR